MLPDEFSKRWNIQKILASGWTLLTLISIVKQNFGIVKQGYHHGNFRQTLVRGGFPVINEEDKLTIAYQRVWVNLLKNLLMSTTILRFVST